MDKAPKWGGGPLNLIESLSRSSSREILCTKDLHLCLRETATRGAGERKQCRRLLSKTTHFVHPSIRTLYPKHCMVDVCFCVVSYSDITISPCQTCNVLIFSTHGVLRVKKVLRNFGFIPLGSPMKINKVIPVHAVT